ncbi:MAG: hypothetical protein IPF82_03935 [Blastocatellia bacterium]|nr:hypothetical protein [Blastocatellia bacterium]
MITETKRIVVAGSFVAIALVAIASGRGQSAAGPQEPAAASGCTGRYQAGSTRRQAS